MAFQMKGQGATEYLVLLAVVLIIALVSISLLGFFPGLASDAKITQSSTYWRGQASPLAILDASFSTNGTGQVVISNNDASRTITVETVSVAAVNSNKTGTSSDLPKTLSSGDQITFHVTDAQGGIAGSTYEFTVLFNYTTQDGLENTEFGTKTLMGKYH
jgi:hypothetical protein